MTDRLPRILLHAEGATVAVVAVTLYFHEGYEWWLLLLLALAPDLAMVGYAAGHRPVSAARHAATTAARVLELTAAPAA